MMNKLILGLFFISLSVFVQASWVPAKFSITADNAYAVYLGSSSSLKYLGSDFASQDSEIFHQIEHYPVGPFGKHDVTPSKQTLYVSPDQAVYVVAWSDSQDRQGILFNFVLNGVQISSENPQWRVFPTNYFPQPSGANTATPACDANGAKPFDRDSDFGESNQAPPCPEWVKQMIANADAENLWAVPTRGDTNTAASFYQRAVSGIPPVNKWMWYNSSELCANNIQRPFALNNDEKCHHGEPLIFKLPATAWRADPDACAITGSDITHVKFCAGQCPFRPDGTQPNCATLFSETGHVKGCDCCQDCDVVVMPNLAENYCSGNCPNCQNCIPSRYASNAAGQSYIAACGCRPPSYDTCTVDTCNNKCVGPCPSSLPCVPTLVDLSTNQILKCGCGNDTEGCRKVVMDNGQSMCTGKCETSENPCKGLYVNGELKDCTCDCCDLVRDPINPKNNYCMGKCDDVSKKCNANKYGNFTDLQTGELYQAIVGCGCL